MLSSERKPEMGIARAVGTERVHLIQMFLFEGLLYDLVAAAIGVAFGVAVAYVMVALLANAFGGLGGEAGIDIRFDVTARTLITGYAMGVVLTFVVVLVSAWRVSILNIVTAIRNLPEPVAPARGRASLVWAIVFLALGALVTWSGLSSQQVAPFLLGTSLIILAFLPLSRWLGAPDRLAFTVVGLALVVWWLIPASWLDPVLPEMSADFNVFVLSGLIVVTGATWLVMYNSDAVTAAILNTIGRVRALAPVLKTALTYPLTNRFRTGVTLAMFTLVVFTMVTGSITVTAFTDAFNDDELYGGGFDIRANTVPANPVPDMAAAISGSQELTPSDVEVVSNQSTVLVEAKQTSTEREFGEYPLRGLDDAFLDHNTYGFALLAEGYESEEEVWQALKADPSLAVVDDLAAPRRNQWGFGEPTPDFRLEGFYMEDKTFPATPIQVRDPVTGETFDLTIIAVYKDVMPVNMIGIGVSQRFVEQAFPAAATPSAHLFRVRDGANTEAVAESLESAFLENGLEATVLAEELDDLVAVNQTFNYIVQGFLGLGLIVGVAALGVISARAVVERRQEIGVMRAIGFEQGKVRLSFLIESSMVALAGIIIGTALGLIIAFNVIQDSKSDGSWENLSFVVPWLNFAIIYGLVYGAALLTSFLPARQAARVYPAEALRYE
jgi:putative ABC transport system permease protein